MRCKAGTLALLGALGKKLPPCAPVFEDVGSVAVNTSFTHPTDGVIAFDLDTDPTLGSIDLMFRRLDDDNCYKLLISESAGTHNLVLQGITDGAAGAVAVQNEIAGLSGARIIIRLVGPTVQIYGDETLLLSYNLLFHFYATGKVTSLGESEDGAISDLTVWHLYCIGEEGL